MEAAVTGPATVKPAGQDVKAGGSSQTGRSVVTAAYPSTSSASSVPGSGACPVSAIATCR